MLTRVSGKRAQWEGGRSAGARRVLLRQEPRAVRGEYHHVERARGRRHRFGRTPILPCKQGRPTPVPAGRACATAAHPTAARYPSDATRPAWHGWVPAPVQRAHACECGWVCAEGSRRAGDRWCATSRTGSTSLQRRAASMRMRLRHPSHICRPFSRAARWEREARRDMRLTQVMHGATCCAAWRWASDCTWRTSVAGRRERSVPHARPCHICTGTGSVIVPGSLTRG